MPDPATPPQPDLVDGLVQTSAVVQTVLRELAEELGASVLQVRVLGALRDRTPTMAELGRLLTLDTSSTTGLVDRTAARGWLRRVPDAADGRVTRVELTPDGRALIDASAASVTARMDELASGLGVTERQSLAGMLSSLVRHHAATSGIDLSAGTTTASAAAPEVGETSPGDRRVAVVVGSTRPARICPTIAAWVRASLAEVGALRYELVDLADVGLPVLDEPRMAALHTYTHPHTLAWSELVDGYQGFVFVFPQYNWGYPAVLKNALDYLYDEWHGKPAAMVSYGTRGGTRAISQLASVLVGLGMRPPPERLDLRIVRGDLDDDWQLRDPGSLLFPYRGGVRRIGAEMAGALTGAAPT